MQRIIDDFLNYMCSVKGAQPRTIDTYRESLNTAAEYFLAEMGQEADWLTLQTDDFRAWEAEQMERGFSPSYVKKNMAALRSMYKYLLREGKIKVDPVRLVKNPKQQKHLPTFVKESEMDRLFDYYDFGKGYLGVRDRMIMLMLYHTGMRASELLGLDVADVDMANGSLRVTGKGNKQRIIPFGDEIRDSLYIYIKERHDFLHCDEDLKNDENRSMVRVVASWKGRDPLFLNQRTSPLCYNELRLVVERALSSVTTQKKKSPHVLRHSFATAMLAHGAQLEAIQQLLGHETVATTAIYTHTTLAELKNQYAAAHPRNELPVVAEDERR